MLGLSRCLSWEEQGQQGVLQDGAVHLATDEEAPGHDVGGEAVAPPPPPVLPQVDRADKVAQLQAYLAEIVARGNPEEGGGLPDAFPDLVERLVQERREACLALRGWVAAAAPPPAPYPAATPAPTWAPLLATEPKLRAALLKMQQLDGALVAADKHAAVVAEAGRKLEEQCMEQRGGQAAGRGEAEGTGGGLAGAMGRERRRLQREEQLQQALQDPVGGAASVARGGTGTDADGGWGAWELTGEQEAVLEGLLGQADDTGPSPNPYDTHTSELAAIDAQLAALAGSGAAAVVPVLRDVASEQRQQVEQDEDEVAAPDLEAAKASYQRAQEEVRAVARQLRGIETALRALRTGGPPAAAC